MDIVLPHAEQFTAARRAAIEADRLIWRIDPTQRGLPLAQKVIAASYTPAFLKTGGKVKADLLQARTLAAANPKVPGPRVPARGDVQCAAAVHPASLDDYDLLFGDIARPAYKQFADEDAHFAWQRIAGPNPGRIVQQRDADPRFPVTAAHFAAAVGTSDGDSLARARAEGRLFVLDHTSIHSLKKGQTKGFQRYSVGTLALFVSTLGGRFLPVAIQAGPTPDTGIWTPKDGGHWRDAKLSVQVADAFWAGDVIHLGACHALAGGLQICAARELAVNHPVRVLLWPHFEMTVATNETMKDLVLGVGGFFDELQAPLLEESIDFAVKALRTHSLHDKFPRRDFALRGCADTKALPVYPFRDDGLPIADATQRWIKSYLDVFYTTDATVGADPELAAFLRSLTAPDGAGFADVRPIHTVAELAELLTTLIFQITVVHAAVNYNSYDHFGWPTLYPTSRYTPPLGPRDVADDAAYMKALAPMYMADRVLDLTLPQRDLRVNFLGQYYPGWFGDLIRYALVPQPIAPLEAAFAAELKSIEQATAARAATRAYPFTALLPSHIAQSIHV